MSGWFCLGEVMNFKDLVAEGDSSKSFLKVLQDVQKNQN